MNKKTIVSSLVIIAGVAGLVWWSQLTGNRELNASGSIQSDSIKTENITKDMLTIKETFYDFGTISMKDGNVSKIFEVSNLSGQDINLESVTTSCMCTTAYIIKENGDKSRSFGMPGHGGAVPKANEIIKVGESRGIEVVYDPNAHGPAGVGLIERSVFLEDENNNVTEFKFKVNVTP
jgi:hypothetical protein